MVLAQLIYAIVCFGFFIFGLVILLRCFSIRRRLFLVMWFILRSLAASP